MTLKSEVKLRKRMHQNLSSFNKREDHAKSYHFHGIFNRLVRLSCLNPIYELGDDPRVDEIERQKNHLCEEHVQHRDPFKLKTPLHKSPGIFLVFFEVMVNGCLETLLIAIDCFVLWDLTILL